MSAKNKQKLNIIFDTNILHTESESYLVTEEVNKLIKKYTNDSDLVIEWFIPETVLNERIYQMRKVGDKLLNPINRLEFLLGHKLAITLDTIYKGIEDVTQKQLKELNMTVGKLDSEKVEWNRLVSDATFRIPPFEVGEKEKGFRDSIILEIVAQIVGDSPKTPSVCRVIFICRDKIFIEACENRFKDNKNVKIFNSIDSLIGYIKTIKSKISEKIINKVSSKASLYFFDDDKEKGLIYDKKILERIFDEYSTKIKSYPTSDCIVKTGTRWITNPNFNKKVNNRFHWISRIEIDRKAFYEPLQRYDQLSLNYPMTSEQTPGLYTGSNTVQLGKYDSLGSFGSGKYFSRFNNDLLNQSPISEGKVVFDVYWSVSISPERYIFSKPYVDKLEYVTSNWDTTVKLYN
ncbi:hypothetical protein KKF86_09100 [bacterium]|nr:hypothetical protein [bacterium]